MSELDWPAEFEYVGREHPEHSETDQPTLQEAA